MHPSSTWQARLVEGGSIQSRTELAGLIKDVPNDTPPDANNTVGDTRKMDTKQFSTNAVGQASIFRLGMAGLGCMLAAVVLDCRPRDSYKKKTGCDGV